MLKLMPLLFLLLASCASKNIVKERESGPLIVGILKLNKKTTLEEAKKIAFELAKYDEAQKVYIRKTKGHAEGIGIHWKYNWDRANETDGGSAAFQKEVKRLKLLVENIGGKDTLSGNDLASMAYWIKN